MIRTVCFALVFAFFSSGFAHAADEFCNLHRSAVLDAKREGSIHLYLPVDFEGRQVRLLMDTGGGWSLIKERFAKEMSLQPKPLRTTGYIDVAGGRITHYVTVPTFKLGNVRFRNADFLLMPDHGDQTLDSWAGTLGAERLSEFDVEIDNMTKTVTLYRPDIFCSGRVVRWPGQVAEIPFTFNDEIPELRVELNRQNARAVFDTGSTNTLIDLDLARSALGITPSSPGVEALGEERVVSGKKVQFYSYRFKTLTVSDITFEDVNATLGDFGDLRLVLGMREIAQLNLYIAFKRKIIYATPIAKPEPWQD